MKRYLIIFLILYISCNSKEPVTSSEDIISKAKEEVLAAEEAFNSMAQEVGIKEAFIEFAADDAVLIRGNRILEGKEAIASYYERPSPYTNAKLVWKPDFVDVSASGDLGHTWGHFTFTALDSLEQEFKTEGIFRTVWKKQADGTWKYVMD